MKVYFRWIEFILFGVLLLHTVILVNGSCSMEEPHSQYIPCVSPELASLVDDTNDNQFRSTRFTDEDKITGGTEVTPGSAPWVVALYDRTYSTPRYFCVGTIVSQSWILTSAQCVQAYSLLDIMAVAGQHYLDGVDFKEHEQPRTIIRIVKHPRYDYFSYDNDIALLKVFPPLKFTDWVDKIRLERSQSFEGDPCHVFGWGASDNDGQFSPVLLEAPVTVLSRTLCESYYNGLLSDSMVCVGNMSVSISVGPCQGDWGGPVVCRQDKLGGVASWSTGCGYEGYPAVFTSAPPYFTWIMDHIH